MNTSARHSLFCGPTILALSVGCYCLPSTSINAAQEPFVHTLVSGLVAHRLPMELSNINNVEYTPDGRLFAVSYDGRVHILTDTDSDGLEDTAKLYHDGQGDLLTPVGIAVQPEGVYLAVREKIVLLPDEDGDGRADRAETVATGWRRERHNGANRNDASGVVVDSQGNLYFSLGCADYGNAFLLDKEGRSHYSLESERGTILKVSPDRKQREIFCTGIRFGICLRFNRHGDLFATDQEGDTCFPGGNPLDELLHIIPGRHYGFPFRHPKHLPDVVDEPCVASFGPQHQSTCGFRFNESGPNRRAFGPAFWEGDALVTGFSRGKLWRVPLVKTAHGYVGEPILIASFNTLPTDVTLSADGAMVVSAHSGRPDRGSGPKGSGVLYKFTYENAPQPVAAWAENPMEVRVAFDRPIARGTLGSVRVLGGEFVREGDRFEEIRPGYKVVKEQLQSPTHEVKVWQRGWADDGRTLVLRTTPHPWPVVYAATLYGVATSAEEDRAVEVDLSYRLYGVQAKWTGRGESQPSWEGWLPHLDPAVALARLSGSAVHRRLFDLWKTPGELNLTTRIMPWLERATVQLSSPAALTLLHGSTKERVHGRKAELPVDARPSALNLVLQTGENGKVGPDLTLSRERDPAAVWRDIVDPNASINPDYVSVDVTLEDGETHTGLLQPDGANGHMLIDAAAETRRIKGGGIRSMRVSEQSLMPEGLQALGEEKMRDLLAFLCGKP